MKLLERSPSQFSRGGKRRPMARCRGVVGAPPRERAVAAIPGRAPSQWLRNSATVRQEVRFDRRGRQQTKTGVGHCRRSRIHMRIVCARLGLRGVRVGEASHLDHLNWFCAECPSRAWGIFGRSGRGFAGDTSVRRCRSSQIRFDSGRFRLEFFIRIRSSQKTSAREPILSVHGRVRGGSLINEAESASCSFDRHPEEGSSPASLEDTQSIRCFQC